MIEAEHKGQPWWKVWSHKESGTWNCPVTLTRGELIHFCEEKRHHGPHHKCRDCGFRWLS